MRGDDGKTTWLRHSPGGSRSSQTDMYICFHETFYKFIPAFFCLPDEILDSCKKKVIH